MNNLLNYKNSEVLYINHKKIACDGSAQSSKHPLIYLDMGKKDFVVCPYCSKYFTLNNNSKNKNLKNHE
jgi:uncharacterized Zn-finger protein